LIVLEGTWARLSQVAVKGAQYNSPERHPHPKCLEGTRADLLKYIYGFLDDPKHNQLIWLHGMAGVGKSAVVFTVAEKMRDLKVTEQTNVEKRLGGTFFFSRKHTKRCTTGYFFTTLVYQLATNFPSIRKDVSRIIRDNPALLDPDTPLCDQMEAFFLRPLRKLQPRLCGCLPLSFVIDALDECTSEPELTELILFLAQALCEPDLPVTHILLTSRSESYISKVFQNEKVRPLVREIPVRTSGEGGIISLDGTDVDNDICTFLRHSFKELESRHTDFPQPSEADLTKLASRAGRRFIVASTMMKFIIDDEDKDPRDQLQLMLELTSELLPGTDVYKLYDRILSTCADPKQAYLHLSIVAALADPLPISQISSLLGPGLGSNVQTTLIQLRSVMNIPSDSTLPVNIHHSSIRDYVSHPSNCGLPEVCDIASPHSLLARSSLRLMKAIPKGTSLLDALSELKKQSKAMQPKDPHRLKDSLAFLVRPPDPLTAVVCMLWLRGDRASDLIPWLGTVDGCAWLQIQAGREWLQTQGGREWLQIPKGREWLQTRGGRDWLQTRRGRFPQIQEKQDWLRIQKGPKWFLQMREHHRRLLQIQGEQERPMQIKVGKEWPMQTQEVRDRRLWIQEGRPWLQTQTGRDRLQIEGGEEWLQAEGGEDWLQTVGGRDWLQTERGEDWLQTEGGEDWLQTDGGRDWLQTEGGEDWLQTEGGEDWLQTEGGEDWLQTDGGRDWLQTEGGEDWLQTEGGEDWLQTQGGRDWLPTQAGRDWLQTRAGRDWLQTRGGRNWLQTEGGEDWLQTEGGRDWLRPWGGQDWLQPWGGRDWLQTRAGRDWLQTRAGRDWLQTEGSDWLQTWGGHHWLKTEGERDWLQTEGGEDWLQTTGGRNWLQTEEGRDWLQTQGGLDWLQTEGGRDWLQTEEGRDWLQTEEGQDWLQTQGGRDWLQTKSGRDWLQTEGGRDWLQTEDGRDWLQTEGGRDWLQTQAGRQWLQTPHGRV